MDAVIPKVPWGLLIRSLIGGCLFVVSYTFAVSDNLNELKLYVTLQSYVSEQPKNGDKDKVPPPKPDGKKGKTQTTTNNDTFGLMRVFVTALFVGIVVHSFHRSVFYICIERCLIKSINGKSEDFWIDALTIREITRRWRCESNEENGKSIGDRCSEWGNIAHQQYVSAWCMLLAVLFVLAFPGTPKHWCRIAILLGIAVAFVLAAYVSDRRLRVLIESWKVIDEVNTPDWLNECRIMYRNWCEGENSPSAKSSITESSCQSLSISSLSESTP